ncbi:MULTISPECIES: STAS/SEC14 domain-containing protein [unclassified Yoonia]|uniref:STAS/SEC14 domain-containing protein n=1 Tax=unclassified Yoonia TaxID=2629118 RepID=UPI002AFE57E3|nr:MULTISPECIES: STAS/SEC14 domain-containing protein [unclassified Yoonia]
MTMAQNGSVTRITTDNPLVYAFMIRAEVTTDDMEGMARLMNAAFDKAEDVSMLLIFEHFEGRETGAGLNWETMKAQFRSLANVNKYAVVGAPDAARTMIGVMDKIIPVDARTFDAAQEAEAWAFVGARPIPAGSA